MEQLLVSVQELAVALHIGRSQAYRLVAEGRIPAIRVGRSLRIRLADLKRWVEDGAEARPLRAPDADPPSSLG